MTSRPPSSIRSLVTVLAVCLALSIIFRSGVAGSIYENAPEAALAIWPEYGPALARIALRREPQEKAEAGANATGADQTNRPAQTTTDKAAANQIPKLLYPLETVQSLATRALRSDPLNVQALVALGLTAHEQGDREKAGKYFKIAFGLTKRSFETNRWLLMDAASRNDIPTVVKIANLLFRINPELKGAALNILSALADATKSRPLIVAELKKNPEWFDPFVQTYALKTIDDRNAVSLFLELKNAGLVKSRKIFLPFYDKLVRTSQLDLAYYFWLQLLTEDKLKTLPLIFNGDFESDINDSPFNWKVRLVPGAMIKRVSEDRDRNNHFLRISFAGERVLYWFTRIVTTLTPGKYQLTMKYRIFDLMTARGLIWRLYCYTSSSELVAESERLRNNSTSWTDLQITFTIPESGCAAQELVLMSAARNSPESIISGQADFDDVKVIRLASN
jgi:tetratricopeptide (TPR) repeat protein